MNPDLIALGVMVLLVLSVLVAWWYAVPTPLDTSGMTSVTFVRASEFALGRKFQIGTGNQKEFVRVVGGTLLLDGNDPKKDRIIGTTLTVKKLNRAQVTGTIVLNRAKRRIQRWQ